MGFLLGLICARYITVTMLPWLWFAAPCGLILARRNTLARLVILVVMCAGLGLWRGTAYVQKMAVYDQIQDHTVTLVGVVHTDAVYGAHYQLSFDVQDAQTFVPRRLSLFGTITVSGFGESTIFKGDHVMVTGKIRTARGNNVARISYAQIHILSHHGSVIDTARRQFNAGVQSALPEPAASFGMGLLVGQRNTLPDQISKELTVVGLTHIIAVSGYNLTIILRAVSSLLGKRSKYQYMIFSVLLIALFLLFAGTSPSIVRASAVCGLGLAAWYYGRTVAPLVLLMVSAALTAFLNPLYAWGNVSWYLSFLAFFGVLVLSPLVTRRLYGAREPRLVAAVVIESLCAEAVTLPYVLFIFGQMSTVGIVANVLIVALTPLAMLLTLTAGLAGMIVPAVAGWLAWPATLVLTYMLDIAALLSRVPHAYLEHIGFSLGLFVMSYLIVLFVMIIMARRNKANYAIITDKTDPAYAGEQH